MQVTNYTDDDLLDESGLLKYITELESCGDLFVYIIFFVRVSTNKQIKEHSSEVNFIKSC